MPRAIRTAWATAALAFATRVGQFAAAATEDEKEPACHAKGCFTSEDGALIQVKVRDGTAHFSAQSTGKMVERSVFQRPAACPAANSRPWCNPELPLEARVQLLLSDIRPDELAPQIQNDLFGGTPAIERIGLPAYNYIKEDTHGLIANSQNPSPTMFPQVVLTAASFNTSLFTAIGETSASQARYFFEVGYTQSWDNQHGYLQGLLLQNNINIFRDPRWGRGQETPGEDPFLTATYEAAWIKGVQALKGPGGVPLAGASCKHFDAYSFEGGPTELNMTSGLRYFIPGYSTLSRHNQNAIVDQQDLSDTYLPAFESCIVSGAKGSMCSYNQINGVPSCGNKAMETDLMRGKWGFDGVIVTDCDSIADMYYPQEWKATPEETVRAALDAGTDVSCGPNFTMVHTTPDMHHLLERAVRRALRVRFQFGEFDPPVLGTALPTLPSGLALAREAAKQSMVLLKNEAEALPLKKGQRIALLGPLRNATVAMLGDYTADPVEDGVIISPLQGLLDAGADVIVPPNGPEVCSDSYTEMAKPDADVVVIVGGIYGDDKTVTNPDLRPAESPICQNNCLEAEGCDRYNISWPYGQAQLIDQAAAWDVPVILVIVSGGPLDLSKYRAHSGISAILWIGYPGQMGGSALADILLGDASPTGRLTQTFYSGDFVKATSITDMRMRQGVAAGSQVDYNGFHVSYPGRTYRFVNASYVVYPFGFGLSYETWRYAKSSCRCCKVKGCEVSLRVSTSSAGTAAATSVLLFLRPPASSGARAPLKELKAFTRVRGQSEEVHLSVAPQAFQLADSTGAFRQEPGEWTLEIGEPVELTYTVSVGASTWPCQ